MSVALFTDDAFLCHDTGEGHPECSDRLTVIRRMLKGNEFASLEHEEVIDADEGSIHLVHHPSYLAHLEKMTPQEGLIHLDGDTLLSKDSLRAAKRALGGAMLATDYVLERDRYQHAFLAARPPGHHAEPDKAMGFCLLNNAVMAARHALERHGLYKVAIIDIDAHHGNGSQACLWDDERCFYGSLHQYPFFPHTGSKDEKGAWDNIVNEPLAADGAPTYYHEALMRLLDAMTKFEPQFVIISAGFDAHRLDPLAMLNLEDEDFAHATKTILTAAKECSSRGILSVLEGGYNLESLTNSVKAHVTTLMDDAP